MNKNKKIMTTLIILVLVTILFWGIIKGIEFLRVKFAKIEVTLVEDLTLPFTEEKHISDYIVSMNGRLIEDEIIDSTSIGEKEIMFHFINEDNIKVPYSFKINVVDNVAPVIWLGSSYTIAVGNDVDIAAKTLCGDNEDPNPNCFIEGEYDYNTPGKYPLIFKAIDKSGNVAEQKFTLNVKTPSKPTYKPTPTEPSYTDFQEIYQKYKKENTKIGIDVSHWQETIDFDALKNAGVEFIIIRVGGTRENGGEFFIDSEFAQNITHANELGIEVGIYFYSYANSNEQATKEARWVVEQIKEYDVTLPIAFDWENWNAFNDYNLSFFGLTDMANTFLDTISSYGYQGILYSSKSYLEKLWLPTKYDIWLAHYTDKTNYQGEYKIWQLCDDGKIDGIKGTVDIDILYTN